VSTVSAGFKHALCDKVLRTGEHAADDGRMHETTKFQPAHICFCRHPTCGCCLAHRQLRPLQSHLRLLSRCQPWPVPHQHRPCLRPHPHCCCRRWLRPCAHSGALKSAQAKGISALIMMVSPRALIRSTGAQHSRHCEQAHRPAGRLPAAAAGPLRRPRAQSDASHACNGSTHTWW
jgi:hypothetical protein